jgi:hypothetical protein
MSSIILSSISKYTDEVSGKLMTKAILAPKLIGLMNKQTGVKWKEKLKMGNRNLILQLGGCKPADLGGYTLLDKEAVVAPITIREFICLSGDGSMEQYWPGQFMKAMGSANDRVPSEVLDAYMLETSQEVAKINGQLIIKGDTGITASNNNLSKIDGLHKQFRGDALVRVYGATAGTQSNLTDLNAGVILEGLVESGAEAIIEMSDRVIPLSPFNWQKAVNYYYKSNNYHFDITQAKLDGEFYLPTYDVRVIREAGSTGEKEFFYTTLSNLVFLCDLENEQDKIRMVWDEKDFGIYVTVVYKIGVSYYESDYVSRYTGIPLP